MNQILLGTTNPAKSKMLEALLINLRVRVLKGHEQNIGPEDEEQGTSHTAIAIRKALEWSKLFPMPVISSDGGIEIPSLNNQWSSILTKRQTGNERTSDIARAQNLLELLHGKEGEERSALRTEAVAIASDGRLVATWQASGLPCFIAYDAEFPIPENEGAWLESLLITPSGRRWWKMDSLDFENIREPWYQLREPVEKLLADFMLKEGLHV
tara:strand:+ start:1314 stop:1949 length:636 start_codon:yes stop_codon:yes gene_type:complete